MPNNTPPFKGMAASQSAGVNTVHVRRDLRVIDGIEVDKVENTLPYLHVNRLL